MGDDIEKTQSRFGVRLRFEFGGERLTYTIRDYSGERTFSAPYEAIQFRDQGSLTFNNGGFAYRVALPVFMLAIVVLVLAQVRVAPAGAVFVGMILLAIGVALRTLRLFTIKFSILPLRPSPLQAQGHAIRVIDDDSGAAILEEIGERWKAKLRLLLGSVDPDGDPDREANKFQWLLQQQVIDQPEYEAALNRLHAITAAPEASGLLN